MCCVCSNILSDVEYDILIFKCRFGKKVEHYRVIHKNGKVTVDEEEFFDNLTELVAVINCNFVVVSRY